MYLLEIQLARFPAAGQFWALPGIAAMNRDHEEESDVLTEGVALTLPARNSAGAAASILAFTEEELDRAAPVSLNGDAQCNRQFFLEKRNKQPKWLVVIADRPGAGSYAAGSCTILRWPHQQ
jgi:hypothetical protein